MSVLTPFKVVNEFLANFMRDYYKGVSSVRPSFIKVSHSTVASKSCSNKPMSSRMEQFLKKVFRKNKTASRQIRIKVDDLVPFFIEEYSERFLYVNPQKMSYILHLLVRDAYDGMDLTANRVGHISICKFGNFVERALEKAINPEDATVCNMKISYYFKNYQELGLDFVKKKKEFELLDKLKRLVNSILQYPETSNPIQLEEMFVKMQAFIIANYNIGCPKNHVLLKQARQSLNSVLGKGDIQKYVLKKRYHRLEYLDKLGATVAGIMIFNNQDPQGDKHIMRNIFADLKMTKCNTKDSLEEGIKRAILITEKGTKIVQELIKIDVQLKKVHCTSSLFKLREINKFVILFEVYKKNLLQVKEVVEKTEYLIEVATKKFNCVVAKINEILKYRSAIESELIFPHFVYLSEVSSSLVLYFNHLVGINKLLDHLSFSLNKKLENKFHELVEQISIDRVNGKHQIEKSFEELMAYSNKREGKLNFLNIKPYVKDYCALTMALTNGLLVPAKLDKKLCVNSNMRFGFATIEYAKYAELNFMDFIKAFRNTILTCSDLIILFKLDDEVIQSDLDDTALSTAKTNSMQTQTEFEDALKFPSPNNIDDTWNVWDFHRETIRLANIRQKGTKSTQSKLCYGTRNAQTQFIYPKDHFTQK